MWSRWKHWICVVCGLAKRMCWRRKASRQPRGYQEQLQSLIKDSELGMEGSDTWWTRTAQRWKDLWVDDPVGWCLALRCRTELHMRASL